MVARSLQNPQPDWQDGLNADLAPPGRGQGPGREWRARYLANGQDPQPLLLPVRAPGRDRRASSPPCRRRALVARRARDASPCRLTTMEGKPSCYVQGLPDPNGLVYPPEEADQLVCVDVRKETEV